MKRPSGETPRPSIVLGWALHDFRTSPVDASQITTRPEGNIQPATASPGYRKDGHIGVLGNSLGTSAPVFASHTRVLPVPPVTMRSPLGENDKPRRNFGAALWMRWRSSPVATSSTRKTSPQPPHATAVPSGDQETPHMPVQGGPSVRPALAVATSQRRTQQSSLDVVADASLAPSGEKAMAAMSPAECPFNLPRGFHESVSHKTITPSCPPDASVLPFGEKATATTPVSCPGGSKCAFVRTAGFGSSLGTGTGGLGSGVTPAFPFASPWSLGQFVVKYQAAPAVPASSNARAIQGSTRRLPDAGRAAGTIADGSIPDWSCTRRRLSKLATSEAEAKRSAGFLASNRLTIASSHAGIAGLSSRMGRGVSSQTRFITAMVLLARKAAWPTHSVYSKLPRLNRSVRWSTVSPRDCSGDMYNGVPAM